MSVHELVVDESTDSEDTLNSLSPVVELRQYTLHPGQRDVLIELFDREFVESQEAVGATIIGQFRDLERPNRFVWLRGFADMPARREALARFYGGPVWAKHREAANATMIDFNDVLLLRPAWPGSGLAIPEESRPAPGTSGSGPGCVIATICPLAGPASEDLTGWVESRLWPALADAGATPLAAFVTEPAENTFPQLPVREGEPVLVWFSAFSTRAALEDHTVRLRRSGSWPALLSELADYLSAPLETLTLVPTARSLLHG